MPRDLPWATPYPLPRDTSEALLAAGHCENFGLLMERYLAFGSNRGQLELLRELTNRSALIPDFTTQGVVFEAYSARWRGLAEDMNAIMFSAHPQWRVIVGLGTNDLLDGGIVLHPIFGFPVIPATSLKGVSRAYAHWVLERPEGELEVLLGKVGEDECRCGDLVFLEGAPVTPPVLELDVINPIYGAYYGDSRTPPAGYLSPRPIFFLALGAASCYQFGVASQSGDQRAAEQGARWLQGALTDLGVGAKSAAGYGYWEIGR
jgi:CRISPR-associated protein Cmr6